MEKLIEKIKTELDSLVGLGKLDHAEANFFVAEIRELFADGNYKALKKRIKNIRAIGCFGSSAVWFHPYPNLNMAANLFLEKIEALE